MMLCAPIHYVTTRYSILLVVGGDLLGDYMMACATIHYVTIRHSIFGYSGYPWWSFVVVHHDGLCYYTLRYYPYKHLGG